MLNPFFRSPSDLLEELGIEDPSDIQLEAIAQYCHATILYEPLEGAEARLIGYGSRALITVNSLSSSQRQRFSAAHELGHWMWDRGKMAFDCGPKMLTDTGLPSEKLEDNPERRANRYAVDLLLPGRMFEHRAANRDLTLATVRELASEFQTSLTATAMRLVELTPAAAMLVCTEPGRRKWYFRSPRVPQLLRPGHGVHPSTAAHEILHTGVPAVGPRELPCDAWIEFENPKNHRLIEDAVRVGPQIVLSLLWWKDEDQIWEAEEHKLFTVPATESST
jgi:hypothetical protein